ncbi:crotonyl-CoA carboxylase/reductase [Wukongibacter sp. M2B1]|uniref:crotonyl-CoA carboxylase/reductase n=1 Tax=Wukongibacter sp. M2B1 TaxID=3088895 RepID=UPI003D7B20A3
MHETSLRTDKLYEIGEIPPLGVLPKKMYAWTIREDRFGPPLKAFKEEIIDVPKPRKGEVIICNMATGINYNGIWAGQGKPKNVIAEQKKWGEESEDFHICGSESSGIVYAVGEGVDMVKVGDHVINFGIQVDYDCPVVKAGRNPLCSPTFRIWGYEGNWGGFAQFSRVQQQQCIPKPDNLTWSEAAASLSTGVTVYGMLTHWKENHIKEGDVVLIWGGYGGLGSMAIQLVKYFGGIPVAVVSDDSRMEHCMKLGAKGCINRNNYTHWGKLGNYEDKREYKKWIRQALRFRKDIRKIVGEKKDPMIVIEHPGQNTLPTSIFVCDKGGMVSICGGTTGYVGSLDLRFLWLGIKRLQGCHAATRQEAIDFIDIVSKTDITPSLSEVFNWEELPMAHNKIYENTHKGGNMIILVGSQNRSYGIKAV